MCGKGGGAAAAGAGAAAAGGGGGAEVGGGASLSLRVVLLSNLARNSSFAPPLPAIKGGCCPP